MAQVLPFWCTKPIYFWYSEDVLLTLTKPLLQNMSSNNAASLVPILDGANYRQWSVAMKAFLMSIGQWEYANGTAEPRPYLPEKKEDYNRLSDTEKEEKHAAIAAWDKADSVVLGHIMLRCSPTIQQMHGEEVLAEMMWNALKTAYGTATVSTVFRDFKDCLEARIRTNSDPTPYFDKQSAAYGRMHAAEVVVPPQLQAMIVLAALPQKWELLILVVTGDTELKDLELAEDRKSVV